MSTIVPPPTPKQLPDTCATCAEITGTMRYCAPARCYCGHANCPAFASFVDLTALPAADVAPVATLRTGWDDREGETWIDKL